MMKELSQMASQGGVTETQMYWIMGVFFAFIGAVYVIGFIIYLLRLHFDASFRMR
jgi:hypothetical protein